MAGYRQHADAVDFMYDAVTDKYTQSNYIFLKEDEYWGANDYCPVGEIDVGVVDPEFDQLMYIEVKTSANQAAKGREQLRRANNFFERYTEYEFHGWLAVVEEWVEEEPVFSWEYVDG